MSRIYVASSWRNLYQPVIVDLLRQAGHSVYDFKNPAPGSQGFGWKQVSDKDPKEWTVADYKAALDHPIAAQGFMRDFRAMRWADAVVLVLPAGRSAHLELGWATGAGKRTVIYTQDGEEPELMALLADHIVSDPIELLRALETGEFDEPAEKPFRPFRHSFGPRNPCAEAKGDSSECHGDYEGDCNAAGCPNRKGI